MIRPDAAIKFQSQTGVLIVLSLPSLFPFAYKLDDVWYEGRYTPAGFSRIPTSAKVARELEAHPLTTCSKRLFWCSGEYASAMPTIVKTRARWWARPTTVEGAFTVYAFCCEAHIR